MLADNTNENLRWEVMWLLGKTGNSKTIPILEKGLYDESGWIRDTAEKALKEINTPDAQEILNKWHRKHY